MTYLKAYQAYYAKNYDQCLKLLQELKNDTKRLDLQAQVHFQKKEFQKAYDIYQGLIEKGGEFTQERKDNLQAIIVCAQLEEPGVLETKSKDKLPTVSDIIEQVECINLTDEAVYDIFAKQEPSKKRKKHKKRKIRLPKQYDAVAGPDPERWLPRRDRKGKGYNAKKRRQRPNPKGKSRNNK